MQHVMEWWGYIHAGILQIEPVRGLVIGILVGLLVNSFGAIFVAPLLSAAAYVAVGAAIPMVTAHKAFQMPVFDMAFWHQFAALYVAFLVISAVMYGLRSAVAAIRG